MYTQPDTIFKIAKCQLLLRSDHTSMVMLDFVLSGTKIVRKDAEANDDSNVEPKNNTNATGYTSVTVDNECKNIIIKPFLIDGTIKLHINSERKIYQMDFNYNWNKPVSLLYKESDSEGSL
jgi:hypothetical protein